jgi:hypothetical protein
LNHATFFVSLFEHLMRYENAIQLNEPHVPMVAAKKL